MKQFIMSILLCALLLTASAAFADEWKTTTVLDGTQVKSAETNLGNFVADAMRNTTKADIAVIDARCFRQNAVINAGVVREQDFLDGIATPTSPVVTLKLTPALLRLVMVRAFKQFPTGSNAFLQISGMEVLFDSSQLPTARIIKITVAGKAVSFDDSKTTFTVAMPRELANGAGGYFLEFDKDVLKSMKTTDFTIFNSISKEFGRQKGVISPKVENRLKDQKKSDK
ncbi:MAG: 5'-nucleotidase [Armatimonadota bacterium]